MFQCFHCHAPWESSLRQPAVKETCGKCGAYLHCCRNCRFHKKGYPNECYIPDTEKIADKKRANFCDEFEFKSTSTSALAEASTSDKRGEFSEQSSVAQEAATIKEWLEESDKSVSSFDDLFKN